jgi:ParB-like chromosome segregation protein Spo0J
MPSPRSSRLNLARFRERAGLRTPQESLAIKRCIWQWGLLSPEHRKPATQGELARALGVRRQYVTRMLKRLPFDAPIEMLAASPVTPAHVISMRQCQEQSRRRQEDQERRDAEDWSDALREEEARAQQHDCSSKPEAEIVRDAYPSARSGERELRRILQGSNNPEDRELAKNMFPWMKL